MSQNRAQREVAARERDADAHRHHLAAVKAEADRARLLQSVTIRQLRAFVGPSLDDLLLALEAMRLACDPLRGAPYEDSARVSHADSTSDEGASTRHIRRRANYYRSRLARLAADCAAEFGQVLPDESRRSFGPHIQHHLEKGIRSDECEWCHAA